MAARVQREMRRKWAKMRPSTPSAHAIEARVARVALTRRRPGGTRREGELIRGAADAAARAAVGADAQAAVGATVARLTHAHGAIA